MFSSSFRLGRIAGIEVGVNISLIFVAGLITLSLARGESALYPSQFPGRAQLTYDMLGFVTALAFFGSILWHEMAHALMARFYDVPVRRVVLVIFGGMAEIEEEPRKAYQEFWISFIGPVSSVALGGALLGGALLIGRDTPTGTMLIWLGRINLILAAFNMIPGFPLDGGRVLRAALWMVSKNRLGATYIAVRARQLFALALLGFAGFTLMGSADVFSSFWLLFIAWFLWGTASSYLQYTKLQHTLRDIPVSRAITNHVQLNPDWSLVYALDVMSMNGHPVPLALVFRDDELIGFFVTESLRRVPRISWGTLRVRNLMQSLVGLPKIAGDTDIFHAIQHMERKRADFALVGNDVQTLGVVGRHELIRFAERQRRLKAAQA